MVRGRFLGGVAAAGAAVVAQRAAAAEKSAAARDFAQGMRRFDDALQQASVGRIERGIEGNWKLGTALHRGLTNGDAPSPSFSAGE